MTETAKVSGALLGGLALGIFFFVGLWWTVRKGVLAAQPAAAFLGSIVMVGFYSLGRGDWRTFIITQNLARPTHLWPGVCFRWMLPGRKSSAPRHGRQRRLHR